MPGAPGGDGFAFGGGRASDRRSATVISPQRHADAIQSTRARASDSANLLGLADKVPPLQAVPLRIGLLDERNAFPKYAACAALSPAGPNL
jgi:hypothetical protein